VPTSPRRRFEVDVEAPPFNLDDDAVAWVESTLAGMSPEEKIGQLFINHNNDYLPGVSRWGAGKLPRGLDASRLAATTLWRAG
jgi:hypothetical protein